MSDPRIASDSMGAQNIRLYSDIQIEGWEREMEIARLGKGPDGRGAAIIASISGHSPSELAYLASKMEKYGADAIELSVSNPAIEALEVIASHSDIIFEMTKEVVGSVKIPVLVKLSQNTTNISKVARAADAGGAGVSAINTVREFWVWILRRHLHHWLHTEVFPASISGLSAGIRCNHFADGGHTYKRNRRNRQCTCRN